MKKLKPKQIGPWCCFCPPKTRRAVYREDCYSLISYCCEEHIEQLKIKECRNTDAENRMTEADYQTWSKL